MAEKITIIGCGPGGAAYLTPIAREAALQQDTLAGAARLFELFPEFTGDRILYTGTAGLIDAVTAASGEVGILVSGDPGYFSLAESVIKHFGSEYCRVIPGISSIQVALARCGLKSDTARIISAHAATPDIPPTSLNDADSIIILGGNIRSIEWIQELTSSTADSHSLTLCIDLTLESEQVIPMTDTDASILIPYLEEYSRLILVFHRKN